jgi:multidrug efflux pump subunit AcrB
MLTFVHHRRRDRRVLLHRDQLQRHRADKGQQQRDHHGNVAEAIAAPLETQLNGVDHMLYMESTSSDEGTYLAPGQLAVTFTTGGVIAGYCSTGISFSDTAPTKAIAAPLETQLNGVDHMLYMESTSSDEGTYRLSITLASWR